jgi:hypothetical protein
MSQNAYFYTPVGYNIDVLHTDSRRPFMWHPPVKHGFKQKKFNLGSKNIHIKDDMSTAATGFGFGNLTKGLPTEVVTIITDVGLWMAEDWMLSKKITMLSIAIGAGESAVYEYLLKGFIVPMIYKILPLAPAIRLKLIKSAVLVGLDWSVANLMTGYSFNMIQALVKFGGSEGVKLILEQQGIL